MELRHLRYFAAVVEAGTLTGAAEKLHMSQPPLSVAISQLEAAVGVQLLVRTSRGVEPTSAGRYLLDTSSHILGDLDSMVATLQRFGKGLAGSLTLAAVPQLMWQRMPDLIRNFAQEVPEVQVRLVDPPPWVALEMLSSHRADAAAIVVHEAKAFIDRHRNSYAISDWGSVPLVAVLPSEHHDAPDPLTLSFFNRSTLLIPRRSSAIPSVPEAVEAALHENGIVPAEIQSTETLQTSIPLIEAGLAYAILPDPDFASIQPRFNVTVRRLSPSLPAMRALVLTQRYTKNPALQRLLAHISAETTFPQ